MKFIKLFLLIFVVLLASCRTQDEVPATTKIVLPMGYIPDSQYAPYYVAVEKGYYAEEGLDVTFDYSFETDGMALVGANERPFAIVSGEQVILARAQGLPVVYVLEWFQQYPIVLVSKSEANIQTPQDLVGRSVGLPGFFGASYVGYLGLLHANDIEQEAVNASDIGFTQVESLLLDKVEAVVGYANNEPIQLQAQGESIQVIAVNDYIDMVANGIVTNEQTIANDPDLVQRFVRATLRGLADTIANPQEAFELSKPHVEGLEDGRLPVLLSSVPLWDASPLGGTTADSWQQTHDVLLEAGLLDFPIDDLEAVFTNQFIENAQP